MKKIITLFALSALIASCGNSKKIEVANIQSIYIDHSPDQSINYGSGITGSVVAVMNDGEEIVITYHRKLEIVSDEIDFVAKNLIAIIGHPSTFEDEVVKAQFIMSDKDETFIAVDSIVLNYRGTIRISEASVHGSNGEDQKNAGSRLIGRDGKDGNNGPHGENGSHGGNYNIHFWKEGSETRVHVANNVTGEIWKYKSVNSDQCVIDFAGGSGGNGGDAGDGGDGKDGRVKEDSSKKAGDGGNGGTGGNGGNGGNGGTISIVVHENSPVLADNLAISNPGGRGGEFGEGGLKGDGGNGDTGQVDGQDGLPGIRGVKGLFGNQGPTVIIKVEQFDPEAL